MAGITATEARSNLYRLIDETAESHQPIVIMGKLTLQGLIHAASIYYIVWSSKYSRANVW